jgi:hypothetical protein
MKMKISDASNRSPDERKRHPGNVLPGSHKRAIRATGTALRLASGELAFAGDKGLHRLLVHRIDELRLQIQECTRRHHMRRS